MSITRDDVRTIARLARLELSDTEVERFQGELETILEYVARLEALDAGAAAEADPADQPLREDVAAPWPDVEPLHAETPDFEDGFYRVPRTVE